MKHMTNDHWTAFLREEYVGDPDAPIDLELFLEWLDASDGQIKYRTRVEPRREGNSA